MKHLLLIAALTVAGPALADSRIREIAYDQRAVVRVDGCYGFQTMIEFAPGERIENVGLGEASQWLVVPNKRGDMLFVKPAYKTTHSNMTVSTDRRRYSFELLARDTDACRRGVVVYDLRFTYADEPVVVAEAPVEPAAAPPEPAALPPEPRNAAYTFSGAKENIPQRVFDNGAATFFRWSEGVATPAVYAVATDKTETLVSFTAKGDYLVADQVAPAFVLRRGNAVATLFNDAYQTPALDAGSPQPRTENPPAKPGRTAWLFGSRSASDVR